MKKIILVLVFCMICAVMSGCSSSNNSGEIPATLKTAAEAEKPTEEPVAAATTELPAEEPVAAAAAELPAEKPASVDLDLSAMSTTVVYSQLYNMMSNPQPYLGKIIKMSGCYTYYDDPEQHVVYHACYVPDATACCTQLLEFVGPDGYNWPADFPEADANIVVTGRLETYEENGAMYLHLADTKLDWQRY